MKQLYGLSILEREKSEYQLVTPSAQRLKVAMASKMVVTARKLLAMACKKALMASNPQATASKSPTIASKRDDHHVNATG